MTTFPASPALVISVHTRSIPASKLPISGMWFPSWLPWVSKPPIDKFAATARPVLKPATATIACFCRLFEAAFTAA